MTLLTELKKLELQILITWLFINQFSKFWYLNSLFFHAASNKTIFGTIRSFLTGIASLLYFTYKVTSIKQIDVNKNVYFSITTIWWIGRNLTVAKCLKITKKWVFSTDLKILKANFSKILTKHASQDSQMYLKYLNFVICTLIWKNVLEFCKFYLNYLNLGFFGEKKHKL